MQWIDYLKEIGKFESYDYHCDCYDCQSVRDDFEHWASDRKKIRLVGGSEELEDIKLPRFPIEYKRPN
jgi:hypothetical protein